MWKNFLFIVAVLIGIGSLWFTNNLVGQLKVEERKKVELIAEATRIMASPDVSPNVDLSLVLKVMQDNETVPTIIADQNDSIVFHKNLNLSASRAQVQLKRYLNEMKEKNPPIEIVLGEKEKQYAYYSDSNILKKLVYFPVIQLFIIALFLFVAYLAFNASRKSEENQVWVGLSKETAHQLGTPISSLMAWVELLKMQPLDQSLVLEIEKDTDRLNKIADRFSKVGSKPELQNENIIDVIDSTIEYLKARSPRKIKFVKNFDSTDKILVPHNHILLSWVIENLCKNAIDAIEHEGKIIVSLMENHKDVCIDVKDTGKGIPKSKYKGIFKTGLHRRKREGWGLGLSLSMRIIENYHHGRIFVKSSEIGTGTTFRIQLNKKRGISICQAVGFFSKEKGKKKIFIPCFR